MLRRALFLSALTSVAGLATALDELRLGSFVKTATYSVALEQGFFAHQGLEVTYLQIPNSTFGYAALLGGSYDILHGALDNVLNRRWNLGQGIAAIGQLDLGVDVVLQGAPNITSVSQLKGKPIMVDAPNSGYVYANSPHQRKSHLSGADCYCEASHLINVIILTHEM